MTLHRKTFADEFGNKERICRRSYSWPAQYYRYLKEWKEQWGRR